MRMIAHYDIDRRTANPLATRYVAPGRLPWIATGDATLENLVEKFHALNRCCQIVGPHGSGKSTLLEHLIVRLGHPVIRIDADGYATQLAEQTSAGPQTIWWFKLRRGSAGMKRFDRFWRQWKFGGILVLDGGEQLSWWRRLRLRSWATGRARGLIVTSHTDLGLDTLLRTQVTSQLAKEVVRLAFREARGESDLPDQIERIDWNRWLAKHRGNLRECLMELYDQMEIIMREAK